MNKDILIISIEGNIGSGKSTLLSNLKKQFNDDPNVIFLKEPVDEWEKIKDENGVTILEKFYADQVKYSFPFQMMAYISRLKLLKESVENIKTKRTELLKTIEKNTNSYGNKSSITSDWAKACNRYHRPDIIITERSLFTDKMVFAKMLYDSGKIEYVNYQIYLNWFDTFSKEFPIDKIIYVKADPEICHNRIHKRSRDGEDNIPFDYLSSCNEYHEKMLDKNLDECVCDNQLVLDGNNDIYENNNILVEWLSTINDFINN
jgi:deoxyadenosine/deoxycytidine kinase